MEEFRDIPGYEGLYQVSNLGRVKSFWNKTEKILKPAKNSSGYVQVILCKSDTKKGVTIHQLIAMAFLGHEPCGHELVIDHINNDKTDNRVENLQIVTNRFNVYKTQGRHTSKYKGVSLHKKLNKWVSNIMINGKLTYLGLFNCELAAHQAYQNKLKEIL